MEKATVGEMTHEEAVEFYRKMRAGSLQLPKERIEEEVQGFIRHLSNCGRCRKRGGRLPWLLSRNSLQSG